MRPPQPSNYQTTMNEAQSKHLAFNSLDLAVLLCCSGLLTIAAATARIPLTMLVVLILGAYETWRTRTHNLGYFSPYTLLVVSAVIYTVPFTLTYVSGALVDTVRTRGLLSGPMQIAIWLHGVALVSFVWGQRLSGGHRGAESRRFRALWFRVPVRIVGATLVLLGSGLLALLLIRLGGIEAVGAKSYAARYLQLRGLGPALEGLSLVGAGGLMVVWSLGSGTIGWKLRVAALLLLALFFGWTLLFQKRGPAVAMVISVLVVLQSLGKRLGGMRVAFVAAALLGGSVALGISRGGSNVDWRRTLLWRSYAPGNGELTASVLTTYDIIDAVPRQIPFQLGATYLKALPLLIPRRLWDNRPLSASEWYVHENVPLSMERRRRVRLFTSGRGLFQLWFFRRSAFFLDHRALGRVASINSRPRPLFRRGNRSRVRSGRA